MSHPDPRARRRGRWRLAALPPLPALLLGACASPGDPGPSPFTGPASTPPAAWSVPDPAMPARPAQPAPAGLGDPLLASLMAEAVAHAPDLRSARAQLAQARALRELARAQLAPSITASASASRSHAAAGTGLSTTRNAFDAGLDASWEPDLTGRLGAALAGAVHDERAAEATLADAHVAMAAQVAHLYGQVATAQARRDAARRSLDVLQGLLELTDVRARAGLGSDEDLQQARAAVQTTRASLAALGLSIDTTRQALAVLLGRPPAGLDATLPDPVALPGTDAALAVGVPADALRRRPDVRAAEEQLLAELARSRAARDAMRPRLTLSGSLGVQGATLDALTGGHATVASIAAQLAAPLLDGGRLRAQLHVQGAVQERAAAAWEKAVGTALGDVASRLLALRAARERSTLLAAAVDAAREAARLARIRHETGLADFTTVLDAQRTLASADDALAAARGDAFDAVVGLHAGLGASWREDADLAPPPGALALPAAPVALARPEPRTP